MLNKSFNKPSIFFKDVFWGILTTQSALCGGAKSDEVWARP